MRTERLGPLASRTLAILLALHALDLVRGLVGNRVLAPLLTPAGWLTGAAVEAVVVIAVAAALWLRAEAIGAWLLGPAPRSRSRAARLDADLEATVLRAVGLWIVLVALPGIVYWAIVIATPARVRIPPNPGAYVAEDLAEAALGAIALLAAPRLSAWLRRRRRAAAPATDARR